MTADSDGVSHVTPSSSSASTGAADDFEDAPMPVWEPPFEPMPLAKVPAFQGCRDWANDLTTHSKATPATAYNPK